MTRLEEAKKQYAALGIDVDAVIETLKKQPVSLHCWQGDDVKGFDKTVHLPVVFKPQVTTPVKLAHQTSLWQIWIW